MGVFSEIFGIAVPSSRHCFYFEIADTCRCRYCFYSIFVFFAQHGATRCTDQGEIWRGGAYHRSTPPAKLHLDRLKGVDLRPQNINIWNFIILLLPLRGRSLARFLQNLHGLCASSVYMHKYASSWFILTNDKTIKQLTRWGIFSHIFDDPKRLNYWWDLKKIARWNDDTNHLYHHAKFGGNRSTHLGVRGQSVMFFTLYVLIFFWYMYVVTVYVICIHSHVSCRCDEYNKRIRIHPFVWIRLKL